MAPLNGVEKILCASFSARFSNVVRVSEKGVFKKSAN